jgi:CIC family chloride channel protein
VKSPFSFLTRPILVHFDERLKLILIAAVIGTCGGLAAAVLNFGLRTGSSWLHQIRSHWIAIVFPAIGAFLSVVFLRYGMKDVEYHGVPEVIYSLSRRGGLLRFRSSFSRLISCWLTLVSGGSAGPEAPVVISGASLGSNIASRLYLRDRHRKMAVGCGAAAAIASIFNAPITGIVFSIEVIFGEWTPVNLIPIAIASIAGTEVSRILQGNQIPFQHRPFVVNPQDLIACIGLAILTAIVSVLLIRTLRIIRTQSKKYIPRLAFRAMFGGLIVGMIGVIFPDVLGEGYEHIRGIIGGEYNLALFMAGSVAVAKIIATSSTVGTGGSGGIFAPSLVIGSYTGLFYQKFLTGIFPDASWGSRGYFPLLGMAGLLSSVLQAPLTGIFLIMEITGGYDVLVSVVLVSIISTTLSRLWEPHSIYHAELIKRGELIQPRTDKHILSELSVSELIEKNTHVISPELTLHEFIKIVERSHRNHFVVEDPLTGEFLGMVNLDNIRPYLFNRTLYDSVLVEEFMNRKPVTVSLEDDLPHIMEKFEATRSWSLPVVQGGKFIGLISKATLFDYYRKEMLVQEEK